MFTVVNAAEQISGLGRYEVWTEHRLTLVPHPSTMDLGNLVHMTGDDESIDRLVEPDMNPCAIPKSPPEMRRHTNV